MANAKGAGRANVTAATKSMFYTATYGLAEQPVVVACNAKNQPPPTERTAKREPKNTVHGQPCGRGAATQTLLAGKITVGAEYRYVTDGIASRISMPTWATRQPDIT